MNTKLQVGQRVTCPVDDGEGTIEYRFGELHAINSRWATVDIEGTLVKVGKTKVEAAEEPEPVVEDTADVVLNCRTSNGRKSRDNADYVAQMLREKTLEQAYQIAAKFLDIPQNTLEMRYADANNGRQRMCLGNLMRGKLNRQS